MGDPFGQIRQPNVRDDLRRVGRESGPAGVRSIAVLCRHFDCGVEVDGPGPSTWRDRTLARLRHGQTVFTKPPNMQLDSPFDSTQGCINRPSGCHASWQIWHRRAPITAGVAVDADEVLPCLHRVRSFHPAWRFTEASVPFALRHIITQTPADSHAPWLRRMLELTMTAFRAKQDPPLGLKPPDDRTNLHATTLPQRQSAAGQRFTPSRSVRCADFLASRLSARSRGRGDSARAVPASRRFQLPVT
jgi:hypothetical protein